MAAGEVVVDEAAGLHGGVRGGRADEDEARALERLRRAPTDSGVVAGTSAVPRRVAAAAAGRRTRRARRARRAVAQRDGGAGVGDRGLDLGPVADDAGVGQQPLDVVRRRSAATASGSKPANAARKPSRLRRIVSQDSPDWNASSVIRSKSARSPCTGRPHSSSWYRRYSGALPRPGAAGEAVLADDETRRSSGGHAQLPGHRPQATGERDRADREPDERAERPGERCTGAISTSSVQVTRLPPGRSATSNHASPSTTRPCLTTRQ